MTTTKVNTRKEILNRARIIFALVSLFGIYLIISIFKLQYGLEKDFSIEQEKKNTRVRTVYGIRGNIYSGEGGLLATSVPTYDIMWDSKVAGLSQERFYSKLDSLSMLLARNFKQKNREEWSQKLKEIKASGHRYYPLLTEIGFDKVKEMNQWPLIGDGKFKSGFWVVEKGKRMYFMGEMAKRSIGSSKNGVNIGLEGAFDSLLKGQSAQIMEQRLPGNIWRPITIGDGAQAENGKDIVTTLDTRFQDITQYALNKALSQHKAKHGCAVVMEVRTGQIKAMANLKRGQDGQYYESMNYAVDQFMEPGSTFKIISALALLEDDKAKLNDTIPTLGGKVTYSDKTIRDDEHSRALPTSYTLQECIEQSSNVGISQFVYKSYQDNPEKFIAHLEKLHLNIKPNFDIPSSNNPVIISPGHSLWSPVTLPSMSIGYASQISPLQVLSVYNTIANNGTLMQPYMVKEILQNGKSLYKIEPKVLQKKACSKSTAKALQISLKGVVERGTAQRAFKECLVAVAGKTGTARIANQNGRGYSDKHMASFVGYFPANNPEYSIIVVVNEPSAGDIYGAGVAAPVFKEIANKIYSTHIRVQPEYIPENQNKLPLVRAGNPQRIIPVLEEFDLPYKVEDKKATWVTSQTETNKIALKTSEIPTHRVPDFKNLGAREAYQLASNLGIKTYIKGAGRVYGQSLLPGTRIQSHTSIILYLKP